MLLGGGGGVDGSVRELDQVVEAVPGLALDGSGLLAASGEQVVEQVGVPAYGLVAGERAAKEVSLA